MPTSTSYRPRIRRLALAAAVLACQSAALASKADELPVRKPGHWKITTIAESMGMTTIDACIAAGDSIVALTGDGACTKPDVKRAGDQVIVNVTCPTRSGRELTSTLFTGDFTTWYHATGKMTFDPPTGGLANAGFTLDAKYVGPECPPAEQKKQ